MALILRDYQTKLLDSLYDYLVNHDGHPCLVAPTGSGKSVLVASICHKVTAEYPENRVLMLTHQKELIEQNAEKLKQYWPEAPIGVYSASIGRRELCQQVTFAGIQSVHRRALELGRQDVVLIDECHLISHKNTGMYRNLINDLLTLNPEMRIIGLTATPYRLGHGMITEGKDRIFTDLIETIEITELIKEGYLARLSSKSTKLVQNVEGIHKRGGEFIESELQAMLDTEDQNQGVVREVIERAGDRKHWLFFCTGVKHADNIRQELTKRGITAATIIGDTPKAEREQLIAQYKSGQIQALTNAQVLTTGFDFPGIDLIALLRPTMSPGLYIQMVGRGLRPKQHTDHCLILDFGGNVARHGPITHVQPSKAKMPAGDKKLTKRCRHCDEILPLSAKVCDWCGGDVRTEEKPVFLQLDESDIMGLESMTMRVSSWSWFVHVGKKSGQECLSVKYYGKKLSDPIITEYFALNSVGIAGRKAIESLSEVVAGSLGNMNEVKYYGDDLFKITQKMNESPPPIELKYRKEGKFHRVEKRIFSQSFPPIEPINTPFHTTPDAIIERLKRVRKAAESLTGYSKEQLQAISREVTGLSNFEHLTVCSQQTLERLAERLERLRD